MAKVEQFERSERGAAAGQGGHSRAWRRSRRIALATTLLVALGGCSGKKRDFATTAPGDRVSISTDAAAGQQPTTTPQSPGAAGTGSEFQPSPGSLDRGDGGSNSASLPTSVEACGDACSGDCAPGAALCASLTQRVECGVDAVWGDPVTCTNACLDGACAGECVPAGTECVSSTRFRSCSELGVWSEPADCDNACVGAACGGECKPGQTRCATDTGVQTCDDQGQWGPTTPCQNACAGEACAGECAPGATRCSSETALQTCNAQGQFAAATACPFACVDGSCAGECSPGSGRCDPAEGTPQFCSDAGLWQPQPACQFACTGSGTCTGECTPGSRRCSPGSGAPQLCSGAGFWQNQPSCQFVCNAGFCGGECVPASTRCDPATGRPQLCSPTGAWQTQAACATGSACSGGACLCSAGFESCGNECVDVSSDADHCGECDRSCFPAQGGTCSASSCAPTPIATGETSPRDVFLSDTHVFWTTGGNLVRRVPKAGGATTTVFTGEAGIGGGLSDGLIANGQLYFSNGTTENGGISYRVMRANLDGTSPSAFSPVYSNLDDLSIDSVAASSGFVFHAVLSFRANTTQFFRAPALGQGQNGAGTQTDLGTITGRVGSMTASGNCIFYTATPNTNQIIRKCSAAEAAVHHLGIGNAFFRRTGSIGSSNLFFTDGGGLARIGVAANSQDQPLTDVNPGAPTVDPFDATALYYFIQTGSLGAPACTTAHTLFRAGTDIGAGSPVAILPPPHECPTQVAVDASALYWSNSEGGTVMKVGK
jgi:hypothetical protein